MEEYILVWRPLLMKINISQQEILKGVTRRTQIKDGRPHQLIPELTSPVVTS